MNETRLIPQEIWEEEPFERIEHRTVMEERHVPQVKSLYDFSGHGMLMAKGEVCFFFHTPDVFYFVNNVSVHDFCVLFYC